MTKIGVWVEDYRPEKVKDIIMPEKIKTDILESIKKRNIPNLVFSGEAGLGKTTLAKAIAREFKASTMFINGASERNIDIVRDNIVGFLSSKVPTSSLVRFKIVIIDEIDGMTNAAQNSLKATIEANQHNARFIYTTNHLDKIIDPLRSRVAHYNFNINNENKGQIATQMGLKLKDILISENISFDPTDVKEIVKAYFPDFRQILNEAQKNSITDVLLNDFSSTNDQLTNLHKALIANDFEKIKTAVSSVTDIDMTMLRMFNAMDRIVLPTSYKEYTKLFSQYLFQSKNTISKEVNFLSLLIEITEKCKMKQ
jgi:replication factor C small subunit